MNDKIKHILDTAYKTDSIAKNKWRIENRKQLREQRKKELKELMEKDKTMSNNKQNLETLTYVILPTISNHKIENVEWVFQFNDDEPVFLAEPSPYGGAKEVTFTISNTTDSYIVFMDNKGNEFKIFAREKGDNNEQQ